MKQGHQKEEHVGGVQGGMRSRTGEVCPRIGNRDPPIFKATGVADADERSMIGSALALICILDIDQCLRVLRVFQREDSDANATVDFGDMWKCICSE
jgi:hypothetical protein